MSTPTDPTERPVSHETPGAYAGTKNATDRVTALVERMTDASDVMVRKADLRELLGLAAYAPQGDTADVIERAARALFDSDRAEGTVTPFDLDWDEHTRDGKARQRYYARAEALLVAGLLAASPAAPQAADEVRKALALLVEAITPEVNEKGAGGYLLARLTDARHVLASTSESAPAPADDEASLAPDEVLPDGARWVLPRNVSGTFLAVASWRDGADTGVGITTWRTQVNVATDEARALAVRILAAADHADAALAALKEEQR